MPLFMDRHDTTGVTAEEVADAHVLDVATQQRHGVRYVTYWFDPDDGTVFCLAEGPSKEAVEEVHREAHGLIATSVIEVTPSRVTAFMGEMPEHPVGEAYVESAVRAVMFTDICGSTELTQKLGDEAAMGLLREHDTLVRAALKDHGGREVKHTGDGIMSSFSSVSRGVEAAIDIQKALAERNQGADPSLDVRIGISAGEPVTDADDLFGAAVQLASRLCACTRPGGIMVSVAVRELCIGKRLQFADAGTVELKGFAEPTHVYEVTWR